MVQLTADDVSQFETDSCALKILLVNDCSKSVEQVGLEN